MCISSTGKVNSTLYDTLVGRASPPEQEDITLPRQQRRETRPPMFKVSCLCSNDKIGSERALLWHLPLAWSLKAQQAKGKHFISGTWRSLDINGLLHCSALPGFRGPYRDQKAAFKCAKNLNGRNQYSKHFVCPGVKNWGWFHWLSGAPPLLRALQDKEHSFTLPLSACHQWAMSVSWWMYLLRGPDSEVFSTGAFILESLLLHITAAMLDEARAVSLNILAAKWNLLTWLSQTPAVCVSGTSCARGGFCLLINPQRISRVSACSVVPWIHVKF